METITPTEEQARIIELFATGESLKIQAGAGTGKTSTLKLIARSATDRRGVYVAFNKAIVTETAASMPGNVTCSTAHSLAYRAVGRRYSRRLNAPRMKAMEIARRLRIDPFSIDYGTEHKTLAAGYLAGLVMRTVGNFCNSADRTIAADHVPYIDGIDVPGADGRRGWANNRNLRAHVMPYVTAAWADLQDPAGSLRFDHAHYLKIWQLGNPVIPADFILVDEAQDLNPVLCDIIGRQTCQRIYVGDSAQQIYAFTGAVNAMDTVETTHEAYLTQSFRFGQAVADVANGLLGRIGAELRLRGHDPIASVVAPVPEPDCVLTRTNAGAVLQLLQLLEAGRKVAIVGGGTEVLSFARAVEDLQREGWTAHPELACFTSWGEVQDYVEQDPQGGELKLLVSLIDKFGTAAIIRALDGSVTEANADVIVSTAHKSKGRQWHSVQLGGDFFPPKDGAADVSVDELRLLYVACTRAQHELDVEAVPHALAAPGPGGPDDDGPGCFIDVDDAPALIAQAGDAAEPTVPAEAPQEPATPPAYDGATVGYSGRTGAEIVLQAAREHSTWGVREHSNHLNAEEGIVADAMQVTEWLFAADKAIARGDQ